MSSHPIDVHVGARVRLRRNLLGFSQTDLGKMLGITFQQIQKYERGSNRIAASRLYRMGQVLDVPVAYFFDGLESGKVSPEMAVVTVLLAERETPGLIRAYYQIKDHRLRKRALELLKALGKPEKTRKPRQAQVRKKAA